MTAEIAILNKTAVALATDSAVTISTESTNEKIFDTADKLFELSNCNPIGIMLYNGMNFMGVPLPSLIRQFRERCPAFNKIEEAAFSFLEYLNEFGNTGSTIVKSTHLNFLIRPIIVGVVNRFNKELSNEFDKYYETAAKSRPNFKINEIATRILDDSINFFEQNLIKREDASFIGAGTFVLTKEKEELIREIVDSELPGPATIAQRKKALEIGKLYLKKNLLSASKSGIVIAGFGAGELFPTLISYEVDGMVCGRLKYVKTNSVDIDRNGPRASVIPFAQKEMVERFLYGLDEKIRSDITKFCGETIPKIRIQIFEKLELPAGSREELEDDAKKAEAEFMKGLSEEAFEKIRSDSRAEIEDMVEFMPKPELATMAEALVNLTSIKRRVSRGMETVGGPIDVAVISQSEGFVWVKRKHYFPVELNARYFARVNKRLMRDWESSHGHKQLGSSDDA